MKAIKIFKKILGTALISLSMFLICVADSPCSTLVFIVCMFASPVCILTGMFLVSPKETARMLIELIEDFKK